MVYRYTEGYYPGEYVPHYEVYCEEARPAPQVWEVWGLRSTHARTTVQKVYGGTVAHTQEGQDGAVWRLAETLFGEWYERV